LESKVRFRVLSPIFFLISSGSTSQPNSFQVLKIERVESTSLWEQYLIAKNTIIKKHNGKLANFPSSQYLTSQENSLKVPWLDSTCNETYLFHGTSPVAIDAITKQGGFDVRFAKSGGMFGIGVYLAENSSKSNQYVPCPVCKGGSIGMKQKCNCGNSTESHVYKMILCRTVLGNVFICKQHEDQHWKKEETVPNLDFETLKDKSYLSDFVEKLPVPKDAKENPSWNSFDSVLGEAHTFGGISFLRYREMVVYESKQVYPEYVIYYLRK
jgi:hypothetical protein